MSAEKGDPFRDLTFSGAPSDYRAFRRKILLSIAALEPKQLPYAGPRILTKLQGKAWRATEHLSVSQVRGEEGWSTVLKALDSHCKFLPETELNECVDEFLFYLKRRPNEGATQFVSRFKSTLSRLETLVAADKMAQKARKRKRRGRRTTADTSSAARPRQDPLPARAQATPPASSVRRRRWRLKIERLLQQRSRRRHRRPSAPCCVNWKGWKKATPRPTEVVLGHLFMKKYGLTREQRTMVVRATGGSSRFSDVERIMRASDFEDRGNEAGRG